MDATQIAMLLGNGIQETTFQIVRVDKTNNVGVPIGQGACKAVVLYLNKYMRNSESGIEQGINQIYYGDSNGQEFELLAGVNSAIIFCSSLEKVFVRNPFPAEARIQVLVYN